MKDVLYLNDLSLGGSGQFQQSAAFNNTNGVVTLAAKPPGDQNNFWKGHLESLLAEVEFE